MSKKILIASIVLCVLLLSQMPEECFADGPSQTVKAVVPNVSGLVAHYEFEGDANDIAGTNHGTECNNPTYGAGVFGQAINLDGDGDYLNCGKASSFDLANQITVAVWIKVSMFDKKYQAIVTKGDNSWRLGRAGGTNNIEFACNGTAITRWTGWGEVPWSILGTTSVNDGKWHHIAGVFDGTGLFLYIDGVLEAAKGAGNSIDISNHDMCIGANAQVPGREWNGLIDDLRIYNYTLSQAEIVSIMGKSEIYPPLSLPSTLYNIAKRYDGLKKSEEAKGVCQLILQRHSDSSSAHGAQLYLSKRNILSLIKSKEFATAQAEFDNLIADFNDHPDLAEALYAIAQAYSPPRKFKEAESVYKQLLQLFPHSPYAVEALYRAPKIHVFYLIKSGNHTEAQVAISKFVSDFLDHPASPGVLYWFAKEFEASKTYDKAKSTYQEVILLYPDNSHALKAELKVPKMDVMSLIESKNDGAAVTGIDSLIVNFRDHTDLTEEIFTIGEEYYIKALQHENQSREAEAIDCYRKALTVWGKIVTQLSQSKSNFNAHAYYYSGSCYRRLGECEKAIQYYQKVVSDWPDHELACNAQFMVGQSFEHFAMEKLLPSSEAEEIARAAYQQVLDKYPKCPNAEYARRWIERYNSDKGGNPK